jgi:outer membrane protein insertion porin family
MASVETEVSDDIFAKLKRADPKELEQRQEAINERLQATFQKSQLRLAELIDRNSTLPTTVSAVTVLGATNTRRSFLKGVVDPLLSANRDRPYTQSEVIRESAAVAEKLRAFGEHSVRPSSFRC